MSSIPSNKKSKRRVRVVIWLILTGFTFSLPVHGQTTSVEGKTGYHIQTGGGYAFVNTQDIASSRTTLLVFRKLIDLSPVKWSIGGPAFSASFHIEGKPFHHHLSLEYQISENGKYKATAAQISRPCATFESFRTRYRFEHYLLQDFLVPGMGLAVGHQVFGLLENAGRVLGGTEKVQFSGSGSAPQGLNTRFTHGPGCFSRGSRIISIKNTMIYTAGLSRSRHLGTVRSILEAAM